MIDSIIGKYGKNPIWQIVADEVKTSSGTSDYTGNLDPYDFLEFMLSVSTCASEGTDTLDIYVDGTIDGGTTAYNLLRFGQLTGTSNAGEYLASVKMSSIPGTCIDITSDCNQNEIRNGFVVNQVRERHVISSGSFKYALKMLGKV